MPERFPYNNRIQSDDNTTTTTTTTTADRIN